MYRNCDLTSHLQTHTGKKQFKYAYRNKFLSIFNISMSMWWYTQENNHTSALNVIKFTLIWSSHNSFEDTHTRENHIWNKQKSNHISTAHMWEIFIVNVSLHVIWWHIRERRHLNAHSVTKFYCILNISKSPWWYRLKKNHTSAFNVIKLSWKMIKL